MLGVEDEGTDTARAGRVVVGAGENEERPRVPAVGDPLLRARDYPAVARGLRLRADRAGIGPCFRLGEREGAEMLAAREEVARWSGKQFDPKVVETFLAMPEGIWRDLRREIDAQVYRFTAGQPKATAGAAPQ